MTKIEAIRAVTGKENAWGDYAIELRSVRIEARA